MIPKNLILKRDPVLLFSLLFPRLKKQEVIDYIINELQAGYGHPFCFPDMSTINQMASNVKLQMMIRDSFIPLNDGIGLDIAATLKKRPFPENLNGTDLIPSLLKQLPKNTSIFLIGSKPGVAEKTLDFFKKAYPTLTFLGASNGFLSEDEEKSLMRKLEKTPPQFIFVGMGNPKQIEWIQENQTNPKFAHTNWMAVGGLFDFYGDTRKRAPLWLRKLKLEWLHIVWNQPYKWRRYLFGIPRFFFLLLKDLEQEKTQSKNGNLLRHAIRFCIVGAFSVSVQFLILITCVEKLKFDPTLSSALGFSGGVLCNYLCLYYWAFEPNEKHRNILFRYLCVVAFTMSFNLTLFWFLTEHAGVWYILSQIVATSFSAVLSFFLNRHYTFV